MQTVRLACINQLNTFPLHRTEMWPRNACLCCPLCKTRNIGDADEDAVPAVA